MKKIALMALLALPLAFTSCGDDNKDSVSLDKETLTLKYWDDATLTPSSKGGQWSSANDFVATVDNDGKIKATHVGETTITYTKDGNSASCKITVEPFYDTYTLPYLVWNSSIADVKAAVPTNLTIAYEDSEGLSYTTAGNFPVYTYAFEKNALIAAGMAVDTNDESKFTNFLEQYYKYSFTDEEDLMGEVYCNANSLSNATELMVLTFEGTEADIPTATFVPFDATKGSGVNVDAVKAARKAVNRILK